MSKKPSPEEIIKQAQEARRKGQQVPISLPHEDLSGLHLPGADLVGADLEGADLTGVVLAGAHLVRANLRNAVLIGASLDGADLTDADLRGADLAGARLDDAVLAGARLEGACLQAVFGDPLSMTSARMDRITIELSEFTLRDIAQMVVRGVDVQEDKVVPVSEHPAPTASNPIPSILPLVNTGGGAGPRSVAIPDSITILEIPPSEDPISSKEVVALLDFDRRLSSAPEIRRALDSMPPSARSSEPVSAPPPSYHPPSRGHSIIPAFRAAEISTRIEQADVEQNEMPVSQRMFLQLSALIDDARNEVAPVSLRPLRLDVQKLAETGFEFPQVGEEYLGVTIEEELPRGTTSKCFAGTTADGKAAVVRIFDPHCDGAALQLPAFQRGLRALNKLQGVDDKDLAVVELLTVAADQTAYVARRYSGQSLLELLDITMTLKAGLDAISSLARTMAAIHRQGLMVRSWKPSNVLVEGLKLLLSEPDMVHLATLAQYRGDAGGYKAYAAPEELLGRGTRSPTADVYSLGKMLEFLLTGQEPLVPLGSPPLISQRENIPAILVEIVKRATAQEPSDRYQTVQDFLADLELFQKEGDRAVLMAALRPKVVSQLAARPMSTGPEVVNVDAIIRERIEARRAERASEKTLDTPRQVEVGLALLGGLGGLAIVSLLVLSPRSVDVMEGLGLALAATIGLVALALPPPSSRRVPYRLVTWLALASLVWLVDPMRLSEWTWSRQLRTGTDYQKQEAVKSLARVGKSARGSQLDGITFSQSALDSLDFTGSSLKNANFQSAFLVEANFSEANITGARFEAANLFGAQLETAIGLEEATCDRYTILSPEFSCQGGNLSREPREPEEAEPEVDEEDEAEAEIERRVQDRLRGRKL